MLRCNDVCIGSFCVLHLSCRWHFEISQKTDGMSFWISPTIKGDQENETTLKYVSWVRIRNHNLQFVNHHHNYNFCVILCEERKIEIPRGINSDRNLHIEFLGRWNIHMTFWVDEIFDSVWKHCLSIIFFCIDQVLVIVYFPFYQSNLASYFQDVRHSVDGYFKHTILS